MKWRAAVLSALVLVVALLVYPSGPPDRAEAVRPGPTGPGVEAPPVEATAPVFPDGHNPALAALRDSALAARARAAATGALTAQTRSALLGETMLETADRRAAAGDLARATQGWREAVTQFRLAQREAAQERAAVARVIARVTPVVQALGTRAEAVPAAAALARAESLLVVGEFNLARLSAEHAERVGLEAGITPPSPQPADPHEAVEVLLADLAHAVRAERADNLRPLYPTITAAELREWERFFARANGLTVGYRIESLTVSGPTASADVRARYRFAETPGGAPREHTTRLAITFTRHPDGWRITGVTERR
jgi:hypothetical protein